MYYRRLRELRQAHHLKQYNVAQILDMTRQQYGLYETGKREIPAHKLKALAEFYKISTDYILEITNDVKTL